MAAYRSFHPETSLPPVVIFSGDSGSGKTVLLEKLIALLKQRGLRVGAVKHHHGRDFSMDVPGKDSWRLKKAGATIVTLSAPTGLGMVQDRETEIPLPEIIRKFYDDVDLVLAEGFRHSRFPRVEILRPGDTFRPPLVPDDRLLAVVCAGGNAGAGLPCFKPEETAQLMEYLLSTLLPNTAPPETDP